MNIIFTILAALPIGFLVRRRATAIALYLAADALVFIFQSVGVLLDWMADKPPVAFGPAPHGAFPVQYSNSQYFGYGTINLVVVLAGIGLTMLGGVLAARRTRTRDRSNDPARLTGR